MPFVQNIQHRMLSQVLYKFSLIFCGLYVVLFLGDTNITILFYLFISLVLCIGIAGIGYALNDMTDLQGDLLNRKRNLFKETSMLQSVFMFLFFAALAVIPWFYLPFDTISFYLVALEITLFLLYSLPPARLKERGMPGIIADSLYAQTIPGALAIYTYLKIAGIMQVSSYYIFLYLAWLTCMGMRNILNHQLEDQENDLQAKTSTYVTSRGSSLSKKIVLRYLVPAEMIMLLILLFYLPSTSHVVFYLYLIYLLLYFFRRKSEIISLRKSDEVFYDFLNRPMLNEFYEIHLPVVLLLYFSYFRHIFVLVLLLHFFLFFPIYRNYVQSFLHKNFSFTK